MSVNTHAPKTYDLFGAGDPEAPQHAAPQDSAQRIADGIDVFKKVSALPVISSASLHSSDKGSIAVRTSFSTSSLDSFTRSSWTQQRTVLRNGKTELEVVAVHPPTLQGKEVLYTGASPSGSKTAVFTSADGGVKLEVVDSKLGTTIAGALPSSEAIALFLDGFIGAVAWSADERYIAFVAEAPAPTSLLDKYRYLPDYGDGYGGMKRPCIYVARLATDSIDFWQATEADLHEGLTFGQPVFGPPTTDEKVTLFVTAYEATGDGFRLLPSPNRPCSLWRFEGEFGKSASRQEVFRKPDLGARCPAVNGDDLVWFSDSTGGEYLTCSSFYTAKTSDLTPRELVAVVESPASPDHLPGIYHQWAARIEFLSFASKKYAVFTSIWGSRLAVLMVELGTGKVIRLRVSEEQASLILLATDGKSLVLVEASTMDNLPTLWLFEVNAEGQVVSGASLSDLSHRPAWLPPAERRHIILATPPDEPAELIILSPRHIKPKALILFPHGGPHVTWVDGFDVWAWSFVSAGYAFALFNFTGSLGFGRAAIRKLLGRIGELDVEQTRLAARVASKVLGLEGGKPCLFAGSHSGLIAGLISARYPDEFASVVLRNPTVDPMSTTIGGDVPDWAYCELKLPYDYDKPPRSISVANYEKMRSVSALATIQDLHLNQPNAHKPTPTVIILGGKDVRTNFAGGIAYYHALRQAGADVDAYLLPDDGHFLPSLEASLLSFETSLRLYEKTT